MVRARVDGSGTWLLVKSESTTSAPIAPISTRDINSQAVVLSAPLNYRYCPGGGPDLNVADFIRRLCIPRNCAVLGSGVSGA